MNNVLSSLQDLQKNLIERKNAKSRRTKTQSAMKECEAKMYSRVEENMSYYEWRKKQKCTLGSGLACFGSIVVTILAIIGYTVFCIKDVQNGTDILMSPKGTVDAFEIILAVFFGLLGACVVFGVCVGLFLPFGILYNNSMRRKYDEEHEDERLEAQKKDQIATEKLRASMQAQIASHLQNLGTIEQQIRNVEQRIAMANFLPPDYKTEEVVAIFIKYFKQYRVNTIQEAINLYISELDAERRHQQMLQQQRQANAYMQSAANAAQVAAQSASDAAQSASDAAQSARAAASDASYSGGYRGPSASEIESAVTNAIRRA